MNKLFSTAEYIFFILTIVLLSFFGLRYLSVNLEEENLYADLPAEIKLKTEPENIVYAEPYRISVEENGVKYAYITEEVPPEEGEDIERRTPVSKTFVLDRYEDEEGEIFEDLRTVFKPSPQYYPDGDTWRQIEYATTTEEVFAMSGAEYYVKKRNLIAKFAKKLLGVKPVFAITDQFYPDPNVETDSIDGAIACFNGDGFTVSTSYNNCVLAFDGTNVNDTTTTGSASSYVFDDGLRGGVRDAQISRFYMVFDTSSLGSGADISSADLTLYSTAVQISDNDGNDTINVFGYSQTSDTTLATSDYGKVDFLDGPYSTAIDISTSVPTNGFNTFALNATGTAAINTTAATGFVVREGHDIAGIAPGPSNGTTGVTFRAADYTGTTQDPELEVIYTVSGGFSFGQWFPF